jgi:membrane protease YdiL (CAAX protease family)
MSTGFSLKGSEYWPPVVILSFLNAVSEEVFYRLVFYQLLKKALSGPVVANLIQSLVYSSVHFLIGGVQFAAFAFCYGLLLGLIMERNRSVTPCIICHFCIDIGNIGLPLLVTLPVR